MSRILFWWAMILLIGAADQMTYSQQLNIEKIPLSFEGSLKCMVQDSGGYLYFLTNTEIVRYNRFEFQKIQLDSSLNGQHLDYIAYLRDRFLLRSKQSIYLLDAVSFRIKARLTLPYRIKYIYSDNRFFYLLAGQDPVYWIIKYDSSLTSADTLLTLSKPPKVRIDGQDSSLWVITSDSLYCYNRSRIARYNIDYLGLKYILCSKVIDSSRIWISSRDQGLFQVDFIKQKVIYTGTKTRFQQIWMIELLTPTVGLFMSTKNRFNMIGIHNNFYFMDDYNRKIIDPLWPILFMDRQHTLWMADRSYLYKISNSSLMILPEPGENSRSDIINVRSCSNGVIAYTSTRLYHIKSDFHFHPIPLPPGFEINSVFPFYDSLIAIYIFPSSLKHDDPRYILLYDPVSADLQKTLPAPEGLSIKDGAIAYGKLFLLSKNHLMILDRQGQFQVLQTKLDRHNNFLRFQIQNRMLCVVTNNYIMTIDSATLSLDTLKTFGPILRMTKALYRFSDDSLFFIDDSTLYLQTTNRQDALFSHPSLKQSNVRNLEYDQDKNLWIFTSKGLIQRDSNNVFYHYLKQDGITNDYFQVQTICRFDDYLFFSDKNRLRLLFNFDLKDKYHHGMKGITPNLFIQGYPFLPEHIHLRERVSGFSTLLDYPDYKNSEFLSFYYKLDPGHQDWQLSSGKSWLTLNDLKPGKHRLSVRAEIANSLYQPAVRQFTIHIHAPFWKRDEFFVLVILLTGILGVGILVMRRRDRLRLARIQQDYIEQLQNAVAEKTDSLTQYSLTLESLVRQKTRELYDTELSYQRIIDHSQEIIFTLNHRQEFVFLNKRGRQIMGLAPEGHLHQLTLHDIVPPSRLNPIIELLKINNTLMDYRLDLTLHNREYVFLLTLIVNNNTSARPVYEGVLFDITRMISYEKALTQAQKMESLGVLAGGIAHEFNNLNTVIKGFTTLLLNNAQDEKSRKHLSQIHKASLTLEKLTSQILTYARQHQSDKKNMNPHQVLRDVLELVSSFKKKDIQLALSIQEESRHYLIEIDPYQLNQAILNLILNSIDGFPDDRYDKKIEVGQQVIITREEIFAVDNVINPGQYIHIWIRDNGSGIPYSHQSKIFEPFFTTKAPGKGTGLGLSLVYGIIKQNNGYIRFESEPDVGTVFYLYFPIISTTNSLIDPEHAIIPKRPE